MTLWKRAICGERRWIASGKNPRVADHPLLRLPQVIVTPHTGSHTDEATNAMGWMSLKACLAVLSGDRPAYVVNPEVYER